MALRQELSPAFSPLWQGLIRVQEKLAPLTADREKKLSTPAIAELFTELVAIPESKARKKLIEYQLKALAKEHLRVPFHSSAQVIKRENSRHGMKYGLHDHLYANSSVLDRCQKAIESAQNSQSEVMEQRYRLEMAQLERLMGAVSASIPELAGPLIAEVAEADQLTTLPEREALVAAITDQGWQASQGLISLEVAWQFNVKRDTKCYVGPKFFDIMTKSPVHKHKGWKTMYNLYQPAYLPEYDMWVVLHDQHMADADWDDYDQVLTQLNDPDEATPDHLNRRLNRFHYEPKADREARVMSATVELPANFQTLAFDQTFLKLLYKNNPREAAKIQAKQQELLEAYQEIESTFGIHADYLLKITDFETRWEDTTVVSELQKQRFFQAFFNTFSSIYHHQMVNESQLAAAVQEYQKLYSNPDNRLNAFALAPAFRLASAASLPFVLLKVESILECTLLMAPSMMMQMGNSDMFSLVNQRIISNLELEKLVGPERVKNWTIGTCDKCGQKNTNIGECNWCKECEFGPQMSHSNHSGQISKSPISSEVSKPRPLIADDTESLSLFLAHSFN